MSVELISVLICSPGNRGDFGRGDSDRQSRASAGHAPGHGAAGVTAARRHQTIVGDRVGRLEHGQAKLEGLLEGLREAITGRAAAGG